MHGVYLCHIMGLLLLGALTVSAFPAEPDESERENASKAKEPDWDLLATHSNDGERYTRVRVTMNKVELAGLLDYLNRDRQVEVETTDRLILDAMPQMLGRSLCPVPRGHGQLVNTGRLGNILVTTNRRTFVIGITVAGFALKPENPTRENRFVNWGLAILCDKILIDAGKQGISEEIRTQHLSPEGSLESQRFYWKNIQARYNKASPEDRAKGKY